jgi:multiple sugar transport system ATP-binding protein
VTELMGSTIHMHTNIAGKDAVMIVPTLELTNEQTSSFTYGAKIQVYLGGNAVHMFSKETEMNLI